MPHPQQRINHMQAKPDQPVAEHDNNNKPEQVLHHIFV
jgi:hypothetical protein